MALICETGPLYAAMDRADADHEVFVDAAIVAIVERLGERKLATLDHRPFGTIRPRHVDTLELLPASLN